MKLIGAQSLQHTKKEEQIGFLEYSILMIKTHYMSP